MDDTSASGPSMGNRASVPRAHEAEESAETASQLAREPNSTNIIMYHLARERQQ